MMCVSIIYCSTGRRELTHCMHHHIIHISCVKVPSSNYPNRRIGRRPPPPTVPAMSAERFELSEDDLAASAAAPGAAAGGAPNRPEDSLPILDPDRLRRAPVCVIVVGMAGSGKTTLMAQLQRSVADGAEDAIDESPAGEGEGEGGGKEEQGTTKKRTGYLLNLDPATKMVPFGASIDIRDTVDYQQVMLQHKLGPNGAILTCLNLFATRFDQVMSILERRAFGEGKGDEGGDAADADASAKGNGVEEDEEEGGGLGGEGDGEEKGEARKLLDYVLVDTPGQIESFSWSASGQIFSESLASAFPTVLAYVVDTPRCASSPNTFMSNMLYACSMMYRTRLPLVIVFNKTDVVSAEFAEEWMTDYEAFQDALDEFQSSSSDSAASGYYASLTRSLSLVLDEFYGNLHHCGVSAATGEGVEGFWDTVGRAAEDFEADYLANLRDSISERQARKKAKARYDMRRLRRDVSQEAGVDD